MSENKRAKYFARVFQDPQKGTAGNMQVIENLAIANRKGGKNGLGWYINKVHQSFVGTKKSKLRMT